MGDRLSISVGIKFDTISALQQEAQGLLDKVGKSLNLKVGIIDTTNLDKSVEQINKKISNISTNKLSIVDKSEISDINEIAKSLDKMKDLSKYKVDLMDDGDVIVAKQLNNELNQTVKTVQNLTNGNKKISISGDIDKNKKQAYSEIVNLQKIEYDLKNRLISAEGDHAKVLQEQLKYTEQLKNITLKEVNNGKLADEKLHNNILKERSVLEDKLTSNKSKYDSNNIKKMNQDLLKQNDYLDKNIAKLKIYQQSVDNKGGGKPTKQADLSGEITNQINKMEQLKSSNVILGNAEKNRINSTVSAMRVQTNELVKYESSFSNLFKRMGQYAIGGTLIYSGITEVKKGITDIVTLDSALRDLTKVSSASTEQLDKFVGVANKMAINVGSSTEAIIESATYYSKLGYNLIQAQAMAEKATVFSNVSDMGIEDATKALITMQKGFGLEGIDNMQRISDALNEVGNSATSSSEDIAEGLRRSASSLREGNNSFEESIGLFVSANSAIQDAEVTGTALKTISMRLRGMETDLGATAEPISKLRDELIAIANVDIMEKDNTTFKSTYQILTEISKVYGDLSDSQQSYINTQVAGVRNGNVLSGLLNNMAEGATAYSNALNSANSSSIEQAKYMDSIEGKANKFSETLKSVWVDSISSDSIKTIVDMGTSTIEIFGKMANTFGLIPTSIGIATTSIMLFNKEMYLGMTKNIPLVGSFNTKIASMSKTMENAIGDRIINSFSKLSDGMTNATAKTATLKAGNMALSASMQVVSLSTTLLTGAMTMGLSMAISAIASSLLKMGDSLITTKSELADFNSESMATIKSNSEIISSVEGLIKKEEELKNKISDSTKTSEEQKLNKEALIGVQKELANILPESASGFDEEGNKISSNTDKVLENLDAKKRLTEQEAIKSIKKNDNYETTIDMPKNYEATKKQLEEMQKAYQFNEEYMGKEVTSKWIDKLQSKVDEYEEAIKITSTSVEALRNAGWEESRIAQEFYKDLPKDSAINWYNQLIPVVDSYTNSLGEVIPPQAEVSNGMDEIGYSAETTADQIKGLTDIFSGLSGDISLLEQALDDFSENGALSIELRDKLLTSGDSNLIALLGDENGFLERGNQLLNEKRTLEQQTTDEMINLAMADVNAQAEAEITKMNNSNLSTTQRANNEAGVVDNNTTNYGIDANNNIIAENNKLNASANSSNQRGNMEASLVDSNGKNYSTDESNYSIFENNKLMGLAGITQQRALLEASLVDSNSGAYGTDVNNYSSALNSKLNATQNFVNQNNAMINELMVGQGTSQKDPKNPYLESMKKAPQGNTGVGYYGVGGGYAGSGYKPVQTYKPSSSSGSSSSSKPSGGGSSAKQNALDKEANKEKEKEVALLDSLSDRYHTLNNNLNDYNILLETNKSLQSLATGKELQKLLAEEINLLEKKKQATISLMEEEKKARDEVKNSNIMKEFGYDADGDITNYSKIMNQKYEYSKKLSGQERENYQNYIKDLDATVKKYEELNNKVEDHTKELLELDIAMKNSAEDMLMSIREKYVEARKQQLEAEKKSEITALDDRIEALKKQIDDLDDEEGDKKKKLLKLQSERDKWANNDDSVLSKKKVKELNDQIAELQKDITKDELQAQIDEIEKTKEGIEGNYETMIEEKTLYGEIDKLLTEGNMQSIIDTISAFEDDFKGLGNLLGTSVSDAIQIEVENAMKALDLLKNQVNSFKPTTPTPAPQPTPPSKPPTNTSTGGGSTPKPVGKGSKVKVVDPNSDIYVDSYTSRSSGTWKGAGVSSSDSLYVVNDNNGSVALSRTDSINGAIGWIKKNKVARFNVGGMIPDVGSKGALGILDSNERVLTKEQTSSFEKLVNMLPKIVPMMGLANVPKLPDYSKMLNTNNQQTTENNIENTFHITNESGFDASRLPENISKVITRELRSFGKKTR